MNAKDASASSGHTSDQLLHLVFGGELMSLDGVEFKDIANLDIVGIFPNYAEAQKAWKAVAQKTVDNAHMRYFVVHLHRLLEPDIKSNESSGKPMPMKSPKRG